MADRVVTHAGRDADGNIFAIGNHDEGWRQRDATWAIQDIMEDRHRYLTLSATGTLRPIQVINGPTGAYLRTQADISEANNLDTMPELDFHPWEIALENTEIFAIHAALVPHGPCGQILMMGGDEHDQNLAEFPHYQNTRIYDIDSNQMISAGVESPDADVFCCGHAFLADGRLLVSGGTEHWNARPTPPDEDDPEDEGVPDPDPHVDMHGRPRDHWSGSIECAIYNNDGSWSVAANLLPQPDREGNFGGGRWYPTLLTLPDGRVLAVGGHPRLSDGRHGAWLPEVYDPASNNWTYQPGHWIYVDWADVPVEREDPADDETQGAPRMDSEGNLIELFEFPEGQTRPMEMVDDTPVPNPDLKWNYLYYPRMFIVPEGHAFMASPNDGVCRWYDVQTGLPSGPEIAAPNHGGRFAETNHTAVLLPLLPGEDRDYPAHILLMGNSGPRRLSIGSSTADTAPSWQETPPRDWPETAPPEWPQIPPKRRHGIATLLPTGQVLFSGGINENAASGLPDAAAVRAAEIYTPGIDWDADAITFEDENWTTTPEAHITRNYHSVALLLPNGRVLTAGSNQDGRSGDDSVKEFALEIYTPEWFHDVRRPEITSAPEAVGYGETFSVSCSRLDRIERVALLRCGSVTHAWDGDQRYVGLNFSRTNGQLNVIAPPNGATAPPGPYMLWVIARNGEDSVGLPCTLAPFVLLS